ncbi:hypothetical protein NECAME_01328 [Necator americanus]|uniref:Peptidase M14 domain-containing protein n=1 Tax=Necator americanus TaxID=51031 RepID=W2TVS9_NECAM|nr:hypothetical protein NECAME_01328 [Necator americanus]ETN86200.1 hypothetical protein NECAME_01328 [Necator americanus]
MKINELIYIIAPASGGSDDWAKANGIKYVYLVELRPEYELSNGFILHKKELIPTAVETFEGVKEVIEAVLEHNKIRRDPLSRIAPQLRRKQLCKSDQSINAHVTNMRSVPLRSNAFIGPSEWNEIDIGEHRKNVHITGNRHSIDAYHNTAYPQFLFFCDPNLMDMICRKQAN